MLPVMPFSKNLNFSKKENTFMITQKCNTPTVNRNNNTHFIKIFFLILILVKHM